MLGLFPSGLLPFGQASHDVKRPDTSQRDVQVKVLVSGQFKVGQFKVYRAGEWVSAIPRI